MKCMRERLAKTEGGMGVQAFGTVDIMLRCEILRLGINSPLTLVSLLPNLRSYLRKRLP